MSSKAVSYISRLRGRVFGRYLIITNTLAAGTLMSVGDVFVQCIEQKAASPRKKQAKGSSHLNEVSLNWHRVGRMFTIGLLLGPFNHGWYTLLDKVLPGTMGKTVIKKILADQIIASPYFAFTFFMGMGTLEGQPFHKSWEELKSKFWHVYKTDWTVWPAAQAVNFFFIPPHLRVLYVSFVTLGWNTFLSYTKHRGQPLKELVNDKSEDIL